MALIRRYLTKIDGSKGADHCIRAGNIIFLVKDPKSNEEKRLKGGPTMAKFLQRLDVDLHMVSSVDMTYVKRSQVTV